MKVFSVRLTDEMIQYLDEVQNNIQFHDRSDILRFMIELFIDADPDGKIIASNIYRMRHQENVHISIKRNYGDS